MIVSQNFCLEMSRNPDRWETIKNYLLTDPDCLGVNKMVWDGVAYVTNATGRHEITDKLTLDQVKKIIKEGKYEPANRNN